MKVSPDLYPSEHDPANPRRLRLPDGIVGFEDYKSFELLGVPDQFPFLWMRLHGPADTLDFVVIEPGGIIADYELELFDEDAAQLGLTDAADAMVLTIVTVRHGSNATATVNLAGPVVVNRRTGLARQCILANYARYSAHHPLVENPAAEAQT
jgi:flagellar assembly factor FliW